MVLDIRTKIILLLFTNYLLLVRIQSFYEWVTVLFIAYLFVRGGQFKRARIYLIVFISLFVLEHLLMARTTGSWLSFFSMLSIGGRLMLPCFMAGSYILHTTSSHAFIQGLRLWRVPEKFLLTLAVLLRFLPMIREDYAIIQQSLRLRGIFFSPWDWLKRPVAYFEFLLVPLIMSTVRSAQDLTLASLTKAVGGQGHKTSYKDYRLGSGDWLCLSFLGILLLMIVLGVGR